MPLCPLKAVSHIDGTQMTGTPTPTDGAVITPGADADAAARARRGRYRAQTLVACAAETVGEGLEEHPPIAMEAAAMLPSVVRL